MKVHLFLFSILFSFSCYSQSSMINFEKEIDFLFYLGQNGQLTDLDFYGNKLLNENNLNKSQTDSLTFVLGQINFKRLNYDKSFFYLSKVSNESLFHPKSVFYSEISLVKKLQFDSAFNFLKPKQFDKSNELLQQLKLFELSGISLLKRDYNSYDTLSKSFNTSNTILSNEQLLLTKNYFLLKNVKRKSPLLAGTLSAFVPGLGLAYAGNNGQALAAFIQVISLGAFCAETYTKLGPKNPQFIVSASLFSFFYVGNIWGSVLSVQLIKNEKIKEIDNNIMVGLSVPIDNFFK